MTPTETMLSHLDRARKSGGGWMARCPAHDDRTASLSVTDGDDGRALLMCHAGCTTEAIVAAIGMEMMDLFPKETPRTISALYDYRDADGQLLYQAVRYDPKGFAQRRPDGAGGWVWDRRGTAPVLYRLHQLRAEPDRLVFVVEGEKDADRLAALGLLTTTNVGGAGKWRDEYTAELAGRPVVIMPDNDDPGQKHATDVARSLVGVARDVRIVSLPGLAPKGDVSDWLDAGGTVDELKRIVRDAVPSTTEMLSAEHPVASGGMNRPLPDYSGIDAADLLALDLPPLRMVVPDLLAEGTTVLASPPKVGKSCLVYQLVVEVAIGGALLGRRVEPGSALYLALEDGRRRGQDRLRAALGGRTMPRGRLEVRWGSRKIGEGLEDDIVAWLDAHPDAVVVAVDTLQRARPRTNGRRNAYEVDVDDLGRLQAVFRDRRVALLVVHHSRKETGDDFLASVSGTYGITGSADSIVVVKRKRMEDFGTIVATGRDIPEAEVAVRFDGMLWHEAPSALSGASFERSEVYRVIEDSGPIFPAAIAKQLGMSRQSVQNIVARLEEGGAVERATEGWIAPSRKHTRAHTGIPHVLSVSERHQRHVGHEGVGPVNRGDGGDGALPLFSGASRPRPGLSVSAEMAEIFANVERPS